MAVPAFCVQSIRLQRREFDDGSTLGYSERDVDVDGSACPVCVRLKDAAQTMSQSVRTYRSITPQLGQRVYIDPAATVIGDVTLGDDVSVWPGAVIRGDMHSITVGNRSNVQDNAVLHITHASDYNPGGWPLVIGDDVVIGHRAVLHGCKVGNRVLVGIGAIVNDGAVIEDEVIIGAGCLVPPGKTLVSGYVYVGNPCQQLRPVTDTERRFFTYSPANYVKLKDRYLEDRPASGH